MTEAPEMHAAPVLEAAPVLGEAEAWHRALLGLAGRLPDELVSEARAWLAAGLRLDVAQAIAFTATGGQVELDDAELRLVRAELVGAGRDDDLVLALDELARATAADGGSQPSTSAPPASRAWEFHSEQPVDGEPGTTMPLDLTGDDPSGLPVPDRALVAAVRREPTAIGLWRAWRTPAGGLAWPRPHRVYVVTVDATPPPPQSQGPHLTDMAARLGEVLAAAGEPDPQVEVCPAGEEPPFYQLFARVCGALLWARGPAAEVSIARVFDEVDPVAGPRFTPDHPRLDDPDTRAELLRRLDLGVPILGTTARMADVLDPGPGEVVPMTFRTDGRWIWTDATSYYLDRHGILPDPDLVRHLAAGTLAAGTLAAGTVPAGTVAVGTLAAGTDEVALHRALAHLLGRPTEEPVWVVPQMGEPLTTSDAP